MKKIYELTYRENIALSANSQSVGYYSTFELAQAAGEKFINRRITGESFHWDSEFGNYVGFDDETTGIENSVLTISEVILDSYLV